MSASCYHCGLPIPAGIDLTVEIARQRRAMCCAGCQAVAGAIVAGGLEDYYTHRDALPLSPREALPEALQAAGLFDHPAVQKGFVKHIQHDTSDDVEADSATQGLQGPECEATLIIEGITCSACVWLNEQHLARLPGITTVHLNYTTQRARVRWDSGRLRLSEILEAIAAIGYRAHPYDIAQAETLARETRKSALWRLFVAGFGMMQVMMYAIPVYLADGDMTADIEQLMRWASLMLTLPVVLYAAAPFFQNAWRDLKVRRVGMDVPVAIGVGAAFAASVWATVIGSVVGAPHGEVYFDSVTMFVFLLLGGRYLELMARQRAGRDVEAIHRAQPPLAWRLNDRDGYAGQAVAVADLSVGDYVLVKPGETIPVDGEVTRGEGHVDEALLTGESRPIHKTQGSIVVGGSVNIDSPLTVQVSAIGEQTRLAAIQRLMAQAAEERPRMVEFADRIAAHFVSVLIVLAVASAALWSVLDPTRVLWVFVAVLVVSCPCALSLATPAALTVATGAMARRGVLIARGHALEALARADHFVFDKTGTLTEGQPQLLETWAVKGDVSYVVAIAAALEQGSAHPLARAFQSAAESLSLPDVVDVTAQTGAGVAGKVAGRLLRLGSTAYGAALHGKPLPELVAQWLTQGDTVITLADASGWLACFRLGDQIRSEAHALCASLRAQAVRLTIFSGDDVAAVRRVATQLGISDARGGMSPEAKHAALKAMQASGAIVAMTGDGVNDAPVLAQAQVSIAMGSGTDLARSQADVVLLGSSLLALAQGVVLAKKTFRIIRQNLAWAFAYNVLAIPLAMAGWVTPWLAGIGMSASSLLVVLNALRLHKMPSIINNENTEQSALHS